MTQRVLFICTGNRARSQMAEALLRFHGPDRFEVHSAGTEPKGLAPETITVMDEIGIDVSAQRSKHVDEYAGQSFDYVITVCDSARQACPVFPGGGETIHWNVEDPDVPIQAGVPKLDAFRAARDDLQSRVKGFLARICIFCAILDETVTGSFIYRDESIAAFMDLRPINEGHALIVPTTHHVRMDTVPENIAGKMLALSGRIASALEGSVRMAGYDLFVANGEEAGQEVFHVHLHVIPRYRGDGFGFKFPDGYGRIEDRGRLDELAATLRTKLEGDGAQA